MTWSRRRRPAPGTGAAGRPVADVAVLETQPLGHRLHYLAHLVAAVEPGRCLVLTSPHTIGSEDLDIVSPAVREATTVLPDAGSPRSALRGAMAVLRDGTVPLLVVPEGDKYLLPLLGHLLRRPRSGPDVHVLLLRTTAVAGPEGLRPATFVKPVLVRLLRKSRRVRLFFLTDALGVVTSRSGYAGLRAVKDPVSRLGPQPAARPGWFPPASPGTTVVGVFGVVGPRKNIDVLVAGVARDTSAVLVVAGRVDPGVRHHLESGASARALRADGRLVVVDRLLAADELASALAAVDVVSILHDNDAPSGILAEACLRGTPSLVPVGGWLAHVVVTTGIGVACPLTPAGVEEAIRRVRADPDALAAAVQQAATGLDTTDFTDALLERR